MDSYKQTLRYLYDLQGRGMKFGLRNIKALLESVGNPQKSFPSIHIAGTNGKGSTASFLASVFMESGYRTALYTSPHLIRFTERIRINGNEIPEQRLVEYAKRLRPMIEKVKATFFEATTCIAFQYFADERVDIAVVESGLGGRLDSINVLRPIISVITNVSLDHEEYLGNTLAKIAREKGGIIKQGTPCITGSTNDEVLSTLRSIASQKNTRIIEQRKRVSVKQSLRARHSVVSMEGSRFAVKNVMLGLPGMHQATNGTTAFATIDVMMSKRENRQRYRHVSNSSIARGLERVAPNTNIQGRMSGITSDSRFIFDVAHNMDGLVTLSLSLPKRVKNRLIVVFGVMKDKNYHEMCKLVAAFGRHVVAVQPKGRRALRSSIIVELVKRVGGKGINGRNVRNGIEIAKTLAGRTDKILVVGSNYVVGEALAYLSTLPAVDSK